MTLTVKSNVLLTQDLKPISGSKADIILTYNKQGLPV